MPTSPSLEDLDRGARRDPSSLTIRQLEAADRDAFLVAFDRLGAESRRRRFHSAMSQLTPSQLTYLTAVDQRDHVALAAIDVTGEIVGVARFIRLGGTEAEPAIAIVDDCQGRGVGSALMAALTQQARAQALTRYRAIVLADNEPMLQVLRNTGDMSWTASGPVLDVTVDFA